MSAIVTVYRIRSLMSTKFIHLYKRDSMEIPCWKTYRWKSRKANSWH